MNNFSTPDPNAQASQPLIQFDNIAVRFQNGTVIEHMSFDVFPGDKFLIYGRSGIGKTTIFRLLLGFERIQEGRILFKGEPVNEQTVWGIRKQVAYVSQDLDIGSGPVYRMIKTLFSFTSTRPIVPDTIRLNEMFEFLRLSPKILNEDYEKLSGGEKQRIALAIALLLKRTIYFLDEVTSSLDREIKFKVIRFFIEHPEWTVLSISHDHDWLNNKELAVFKVGA